MNIVHSGVGAVSHSDLERAQACGACIVAFNVKGGGSGNLSAAQASVKVYGLCSCFGIFIVESALTL